MATEFHFYVQPPVADAYVREILRDIFESLRRGHPIYPESYIFMHDPREAITVLRELLEELDAEKTEPRAL